MPSVVILDQTVPALTADIYASSSTEKTALAAAISSLGVTGTDNSAVDIAYASDVLNSSTTTTKSFSVATHPALDTTIWVWDNVEDSTFGAWDAARAVFTFTKQIVATVSAGLQGYALSTPSNNVNIVMRLAINDVIYAGGGASGYTANTDLPMVYSSPSLSKRFNIGDRVNATIVCQATNSSQVNTMTYGSILGVQTYMSIVGH